MKGGCRPVGGRAALLPGISGRDRGAVIVEFALLAPILLVLVFGIINYGVYLSQQLALNNGVRQGVRLAVVAGNPSNQSCGQVVTSVQGASGPAIAMNTGDVSVRVQRVSSANTSTVGLECFGGSNTVTTPSGSNVNTRVCAANTGDNSIRAEATYNTSFIIPVPFLPAPTTTLTATAVYRCEFTS